MHHVQRTSEPGDEPERALRLVHVTTVPLSLVALINRQVSYMQARGYDVHGVSSAGALAAEFTRACSAPHHAVPMTRRITPFRDLVALWRLHRTFGRIDPHIVHTHTPKAGLLGILAACTKSVPVRVYHLRGLRYATTTGVTRSILVNAERLACLASHRVIAVSHSVRAQALHDRLCRSGKIIVLASGSGNGVDARGRFNPDFPSTRTRTALRAALGIPEDALVIGMVGRLTPEKGVIELSEAWRQIRDELPSARLLLAGPLEVDAALPPHVLEQLRADHRVHLPGFGLAEDMPDFYRVMDVFVLPSYREGLPNALLEASAMRLPVVATRVAGCVDVVEDGVNGTLIPVAQVEPLAAALRTYLTDPERRQQHGGAARERVLEYFQPERIWLALHEEYQRLWRARSRYRGKRTFDLLAASAALIVTTPLLALVAVLVRLVDGAPVFFRHVRPGWQGTPFTLLKFKTMRPALCATDRTDAERITPLGRFLRATSLDELPQLVNVLRGEMSLVGPRPLLMEYLSAYTAWQAHRHDVKPGITGLAQVSGRRDLTWEQKLELDLWYVDHCSLAMDVRILGATAWKVLTREGTEPGADARPGSCT